MMNEGKPVPEDMQKAFDEADERFFANVRAIFGGRVRHATSGAAPIAKEILEFFWACGVPVLEGYGMTETATAATTSTVADHKFGTVGRALPGVELKIAEDGEILDQRPEHLQRLPQPRRTRASAPSSTAGCTPATSARSTRTATSRSPGRKKDIIITAGGKNLTPANIENDLKQSRWISQAVMHGDARPYPVVLITLDEEEMPVFAKEHGLAEDIPTLCSEPAVLQLIQGEIDKANAKYAQVEQVKKFCILDHDLSQADRRADADAEGQAQRRQREVRRACSTPSTPAETRRGDHSGHDPPCALTQPTTAACSSGAAPAPRRSTTATSPSAAARSASAWTARWRASCSRG